MAKKKNNISDSNKLGEKKGAVKDPSDEESLMGEEAVIDPSIIEDTFTEEFSEYNDVDNL